jgi:hypothetical protein
MKVYFGEEKKLNNARSKAMRRKGKHGREGNEPMILGTGTMKETEGRRGRV